MSLRYKLGCGAMLCAVAACQTPSAPPAVGEVVAKDSFPPDVPSDRAPAPVRPHRVVGDFNGDGHRDTVRVGIFDPKGQPITWQQAMQGEITIRDGAYCVLQFSGARPLPALRLEGDCMGLSFLHNEGDLDGEKGEELSLVKDWPASYVRPLRVYSLRDSVWRCIAELSIHVAALTEGLGEQAPLRYEDLVQRGEQAKTLQVKTYDVQYPLAPMQARTVVLP